ncbi:hypothetical protein B0I35DRAFT_432674 [Stachybotrys elegans]|uniref:N-acetyltransferase domain-containing protein n=1 Tax=Stachybotrys elegans TaxID=80388 RepID=A0A8K0WRE0_9HYPO|nr:hypothetical protein B0I35DRAFT_432674 [Stachybotrys elegans]
MGFPVAPPLGTLRLATLGDVPRIATVATAGFYYSPVFAWERRFHRQYPTDTFQSYSKMFADIIVDPRYVALVVEDSYDPTEGDKSTATIAPDRVIPPLQQGDSVVVGAATWKLDPGSRRIGQFVPSTSPDDDHALPPLPPFDGGKGRDKSLHHADMLDAECDAAETRYFEGNQLVDMVVVHPAYWRRGHGTTLVRWGKSLADLDGMDQGVVAADMGEKLYMPLGYQKLDEVRVEDNAGPGPHDVSVGILKYYGSLPVSRGEL